MEKFLIFINYFMKITNIKTEAGKKTAKIRQQNHKKKTLHQFKIYYTMIYLKT